jgi:hypothetical protein
MAKAKNRTDGTIEKLANIADSLQQLHQGKIMVVFEMDSDQYKNACEKMKVQDASRFTIDISGTDFIFLLTEDE